jgi:Glycosyl transferase family 2/Methyltransferase domain
MSTAATSRKAWGVEALRLRMEARRRFQEDHAERRDEWIEGNRYYYERVKRILRYIIEPGKRVLEIRCQTGHLLDAVEPGYGIGVEISAKLVAIAAAKYPRLRFVRSDPESLDLEENFDYIILSHIFDTVDLLAVLDRVRRCCHPRTRLIVYSYNHLWEPVLELAGKLKLRAPFLKPNWLSEHDISGFLGLAGFDVLRIHRRLLFPKWLPIVSSLLNDLLVFLPGFRRLSMVQMIVARPKPIAREERDVSVSVVIPCLNERDNILPAVERIPKMGSHTEILFCDDQSTDGTAAEVERGMTMYPDRDIRLVRGPGICKAENVWTGFRAARGDVLMILDGDLAVMPEELPYFFKALVSGTGEFINGSRLVYPVPQQAMRFSNFVGNKLFSGMFSYLLDQRLKDTLCGTKALWREDWLRIEHNLGHWEIEDRWGDYELLFGASKLHLRICDLPVHYQERVYGVTKMTRVFSNGLRMLGICWGAWRRLKG